ncbi:MAG: metalloregulator ArsR/SmtB family transcription factor [Pseudomonadota bacterium]
MVSFQSPAAIFDALGDPTRLAIVAQLCAEGGQRMGELAQGFSMTRPAVAKHIGVLERAGVITVHKKGREKICRLCPETLAQAADWLELHERLWTAALDDLAAHFEERNDDDGDGKA